LDMYFVQNEHLYYDENRKNGVVGKFLTNSSLLKITILCVIMTHLFPFQKASY